MVAIDELCVREVEEVLYHSDELNESPPNSYNVLFIKWYQSFNIGCWRDMLKSLNKHVFSSIPIFIVGQKEKLVPH